MPKLPELAPRQVETTPPFAYTDSRGIGSEFRAIANIGEAVQGLGELGFKVATMKKQVDDANYVFDATAKEKKDVEDYYKELVVKAPEDSRGVADKLHAYVEERYKQSFDNAPSAEAQNLYKQRMVPKYAEMVQKAQSDDVVRSATYSIKQLQEVSSSEAKSYYDYPIVDKAAESIEQYKAHEAVISPLAGAKIANEEAWKASNIVAYSTINGLIENGTYKSDGIDVKKEPDPAGALLLLQGENSTEGSPIAKALQYGEKLSIEDAMAYGFLDQKDEVDSEGNVVREGYDTLKARKITHMYPPISASIESKGTDFGKRAAVVKALTPAQKMELEQRAINEIRRASSKEGGKTKVLVNQMIAKLDYEPGIEGEAFKYVVDTINNDRNMDKEEKQKHLFDLEMARMFNGMVSELHVNPPVGNAESPGAKMFFEKRVNDFRTSIADFAEKNKVKVGYGPSATIYSQEVVNKYSGLLEHNLKKIKKEQNDDPASYVAKWFKPVSNMWSRQFTNLNADKFNPSDFKNAIENTLHTQKKMEMDKRGILPDFFKAGIKKVFSGTDNMKKAVLFGKIQAGSGEHWPAVNAEMVRSGIVPPEYAGVTYIQDVADQAQAMDAIDNKKDIQEAFKLTKKDNKDLDKKLMGEIVKQLSDYSDHYARAAGNSTDSLKFMNGITSSVYDQGMAELIRDGNQDISVLVKNLKDKVHAKQAPLITVGKSSLIYSQKIGNTVIRPELLEAGLKAYSKPEKLSKLDLAVPMDARWKLVPEAERKLRYAEVIAENGYWINSSDNPNDAVLWYYNANGNRDKVVDSKGNQIRKPITSFQRVNEPEIQYETKNIIQKGLQNAGEAIQSVIAPQKAPGK